PGPTFPRRPARRNRPAPRRRHALAEGLVMRSAKYLFTALGLLPGLALSAGAADDPAGKEAGDKVVITDKDRGGKVTAREGATVLLKLPMQSGTGYSWTVARNSAEKVLKQ